MNKTRLFILASLILLEISSVYAWNYTGSTGAARCIRQTNDGGYIVVGTGGLKKLDSSGSLTWQRSWTGAWVEQTIDSGYIIATAVNHDGQLIRTNSVGDTIWTHTYGGTGNDELLSVLPTDSGFVATGYYGGPTTGNPTVGGLAWLLKVDSQGNQVWSRTYRTGDNRIYGMVRTINGYLLAGRTNSSGTGNFDFLAIRVTDTGDTLWTHSYDNDGTEYGSSVTSCTDGGFAITGYSTPSGRTFKQLWIVRIDFTGTLQWSNTYASSGDSYGEAIQQTTSGKFIVTGYVSGTVGGQTDLLLMKFDANGDTLWSSTFGSTNYDVGLSIIQRVPNYYVIAGLYNSTFIFFGNGNEWIFSIDSSEQTAVQYPKSIPLSFHIESVYPNPFNATANIRFTIPESRYVKVELLDILGNKKEILLSEKMHAGVHNLLINGRKLSSGLYIVRVQSGEQVQLSKVVLLK